MSKERKKPMVSAGPSVLAQIREQGGRIRFSDRMKLMSPSARAAGLRWTAYVNVYAHDVAGDGATREDAAQAALRDLPEQYRRHFAMGTPVSAGRERHYAHDLHLATIDRKIEEGGGWADLNDLPGGYDFIWEEYIEPGILQEEGGYVRRAPEGYVRPIFCPNCDARTARNPDGSCVECGIIP